MIAIGLGVVFGAYTAGIWGYCLLKSYDVTFIQLFSPVWPGARAAQTAPAAGRKLGTITGNAQVTDPGQLSAEQGG